MTVEAVKHSYDLPPAARPVPSAVRRCIALLAPSDDGTPLPLLQLPKGDARAVHDFGFRQAAHRVGSKPIASESLFADWVKLPTIPQLRAVMGGGITLHNMPKNIFRPWPHVAPFVVSVGWDAAHMKVHLSGWAGLGTWREGLTLIPAKYNQQHLWVDHGLNLGAVRAFDDLVGGPRLTPARRGNDWGAMLRQASGNDNGAVEGFYEYNSYIALHDRIVTHERAAYPWHKGKGKGREELSIGLRIVGTGDREHVVALFFEGDSPAPRDEVTLTSSDNLLRPKIVKLLTRRRELQDEMQRLSDMSVVARGLTASERDAASSLDRLIKEARLLIDQRRMETAEAYREIVGTLAAHKNALLTTVRERARTAERAHSLKTRTTEVRQNFAYTSPLFADLSPHLTRVPTPFLFGEPSRHRVMVRHKGLDREGHERDLEFSLHEPQGAGGFAEFLEASQAMFGRELSWLPIYTLAALHHVQGRPFTHGGQTGFLIDVGDFFRMIHPNEIEVINKRGLSDWWARKYPNAGLRPTEALARSIQLLSGLTLQVDPSRGIKGGEIGGLMFYHATLPTSRQGRAAIVYSHNLLLPQLRDGTDEVRPFYMYSNVRSLFACKSQMRHTVAPLQLFLEKLARGAGLQKNDRMVTDEGHLIVGRTPQGDDMTVGSLIAACGLYGERHERLFDRVDNAICALKDLGVIAHHKYRGNRTNPFACKVELAMSKDYTDLYKVSRAQRDLREIDLNRAGFAGGSNFQIGWSRHEHYDP